MDKNKILDAAAKLVAKGAYDKAIKEYQKVLDADPKDVRVLHKLGELYEKKNDSVQAASFFTRVADGYANDGFSMKAIALYKKVLKLDPNLLEVNLKLAELHQQHQLMSEAMAYYQAVANHYDKAGNIKASLDTLKKMVDLDPDNVASRMKLADLYARENMNTEAAAEFKRAADYLKRTGRTDDYLRVAERLSTLDPNNVPLARELANEYLQRGDQKRALAKLQICFKADPRDVATLTLLAQAFEALGQTSKTLSVYKELARVHEDAHRTDEVNRIWEKVGQIDPSDADLAARKARTTAPAPAAAAPQRAPAPTAAPSRSAPAPAAAPSRSAPAPAHAQAAAAPSSGLSREQLAKLLTETDVYVKYGLHDKALDHLRRVFGVDPENLEAHEKAYQIYVAAGNAAAASEQLLNVLRLCTRQNEVERAQPYLATILQENPHHPEVPAFLAVLRSDDTVMPEVDPTADEPLGEDAILVDSSDEEIIVAEAPPDALPEIQDLALATASSEEIVVEDAIEEPSIITESPSGTFELVAEDPSDEVVEEPSFEAPAYDALTDAPSLTMDDDALAAADTGAEEIVVDEPALDGAVDVAEGYDIDPVAVADDAGYDTDNAAVVEDAGFGDVAHESAELGPSYAEPLGDGTDAATGAYELQLDADVSGMTASTEEAVVAPPEDESAAEECDEAAFFIDQGLYEEAREILETVLIAYPGHARAAELHAQLEAAEAAGGASPGGYEAEASAEVAPPSVESFSGAGYDDGAAPRDAFDLAAELADELGELGEEDSSAVSASGTDDYQVSVDEVFSEFKKGLEKIVKPEDVETHYDLGIAYKEMGLIDDAIGEFVVARQGCVGKKKELDCLTMIGLLQVEKGDGQSAVDAFKQALGTAHATTDVARSLRFDLATAWELAGHPGKALFHLQAVHDEDPNFRGVGESLQRLAAMAQPEEDVLFDGGPANGAAGSDGHGAPAAGGMSAPPAARKTAKAGKVGYL